MGAPTDKDACTKGDDTLLIGAIVIIVVFAILGATGFLNPPAGDCQRSSTEERQ